jgi:hypothetical protein
MTTKAGLFGVGAALPIHQLGNDHFAARLDTSDEWIVRRTGIHSRYWLNGKQTLADIAVDACEAALADAGRRGEDVDHVIVSTLTPDRLMPGLAPEVALRIGANEAAAVDVNARRPRSSSPAVRTSCSSSAPRRCRASPTRATAGPRSCSVTARAPWWSPAASSIAAAARSRCAPTGATATCCTRGATSGGSAWRGARSTATP